MELFGAVKSAVTTRQAAEFYGVDVKSNGMARCIFHNDRKQFFAHRQQKLHV